LVDIGCRALMARLTRSEAIILRDLTGKARLRRGYGYFSWVRIPSPGFPTFFLPAATPSSKLIYDSSQPYLCPGLLAGRVSPLWAVIYGLRLCWMIWSPTEEATH
jgi:hypothetical protein